MKREKKQVIMMMMMMVKREGRKGKKKGGKKWSIRKNNERKVMERIQGKKRERKWVEGG